MALATNSPQGFQLWGTIAGRTETGQLSTYQVLPPINYAVENAAFTGIYKGDFVRLGIASALAGIPGDVNPGPGYLYPANPGEPGIGVFQGCHYQNTDGFPVYSPYLLNNTQTYAPLINGVATPTPIYCLVMDDPDALYNVQASFPAIVNSTTVPLGISQAQIGLNANLGIGGTFIDVVPGTTPYTSNPATGGARISKLSAEYLDVSSITGNQDFIFKIKQFTPILNNPAYTAGAGYGTGMNGAFNNVLVSMNGNVFKNGGAPTYEEYFTSVKNITTFDAMDGTFGTSIIIDDGQAALNAIFIPLSVVLTISIPSTTAGGTAFTNTNPATSLVVLYTQGMPIPTAIQGPATGTASASLVTSIVPTATAGASGSVYIPLLPTPIRSSQLAPLSNTNLSLNISIGGHPFAGGNNAVITAYITYIGLPV